MFALRTPTEPKAKKKKAPFSQTQIAKEEESKGTVQKFFWKSKSAVRCDKRSAGQESEDNGREHFSTASEWRCYVII